MARRRSSLLGFRTFPVLMTCLPPPISSGCHGQQQQGYQQQPVPARGGGAGGAELHAVWEDDQEVVRQGRATARPPALALLATVISVRVR